MSHRRFELVRDQDITGISGTGVVAEGVKFSDGVVVMRWVKAGTARPDHVRPTTVVHDDLESVIGLHGHNGATRVEWIDAEPLVCKHCAERLKDGGTPERGWQHATGLSRCQSPTVPYGHLAEPIGQPCRSDGPNPCLGAYPAEP